MAQQKLTYKPRIKAVILSEASGQRSRENIVVAQTGTEIVSGQIMTQAGDAATTGTAAAVAGNTGNPTFSAITVGAAGLPGVYNLQFTGATTFEVEGPDGKSIGTGKTGTAFNKGGLGFTVTAGGTAAVTGDAWTITVASGTGKWIPYTANGAAGPAMGVLYNYLPAATGDAKAVAFVRSAELNRYELTGLDAAAEADLAKVGLLVRGKAGALSISTPAL